MINNKIFKKPCIRCNEIFRPAGKFQRICKECNKGKHKSKENLKKKYFETKKELEIINHNATLAKWKALSRAYKTGKQIWGSRFNRQRLSEDMEIPMTTVLRCLSLDRASKKSMKLMNEGKISASKLAMICCSKCKTFQDEIVAMVINQNLTTYQIKSLKVNNIKDLDTEKLRLAVEKGFSRDSSAVRSLENWIDRGNILLRLKKTVFKEDKLKELEEKLRILNSKINRYLEEQ